MMKLSLKQKEFWNNANSRWNIKSGATRSGKTYLDYYIIPKRIRATKGKGLIVLLGNTRGTLERNILDPMRNIWGSSLVGNISSDNTVKLFGKKVYALGADKKNAVTKIQGAGIEYCYGDEITTWSEEVFQMLKSRLDKPNSVFDGTCNPDHPYHWFKEFLDSDANIYHQQYIIDDNPFIDPFFVEQLKKEYAGSVYYNRYILGQWTRAEGLIYDMFDPAKHVTNTIPEDGLYYISIDYGTANPCSMGLWCVTREKAVRIKEYYYDSRKMRKQKTDEEYYSDLATLAKDKSIQYVVVDPSAASFIETIRRHGYFSVKKANNDVLDGIRVTSSLLNAGKILLHSSCADAIREMGAYSWDNKALEDRPVKDNDHSADEIRYFCNTVLKREFKWDGWAVN